MNKRINRETALFITGSIAILLIGFFIKSLQTKGLGPENFGSYTFITSLAAFSILFFQFGFIPTIKLVLARQNSEDYKKSIGAAFIITLFLGLLFSLFMFLASLFVDQVFDTNVSRIMMMTSPFFFSLIFIHFFNSVGTGIGRPSTGIFFELTSRLLYAIILFLLYQSNELNVINTLFYSLISHISTVLIFYFILKPSFSGLKKYYSEIKAAHKEFGFDYYLGSIANQTSFKIDDLLITAWISPIQLGFYSIARVLTAPIGLASTALNNALFKDYSSAKKIPGKVFILNTAIAILALIVINLIGGYIILHVFGTDFLESTNYIFIFSLAFFFMALYQPFNFLTAKGQGKIVRNTSYAESVVNVLGNFILIPLIGIMGALITTLAARVIHFLMKWYYYNRYLKELDE